MLKFLGVIVCILFATFLYASSAHAASANVMITHIQAGGVGVASQELVIIYNTSMDEVDITDWCVKNKSNVAFACFGTGLTNQTLALPPYSYATVATPAMATALAFSGFTVTYTPTNQSSGSIVGSTDTIKLVDAFGNEVDKQSWTTSLGAGMVYTRSTDPLFSYLYIDTDTASDWSVLPFQFLPNDQTVKRSPPPTNDVCPNIPDAQLVIPDDLEFDQFGNCVAPVITPLLKVTEVLPNAAGSDTGREFIELYNPNDFDVTLADYRIEIGPTFEKSYSFPVGSLVSARSYKAFSNSDIHFSLLNSSSRVRVVTATGALIDEIPAYDNPKDDVSWAWVDGAWKYTASTTPGAANAVTDDEPTNPTVTPDTRKPCASNQFRNPATGRCKLLATTSRSTLKPCNGNQYRSKETNRCRNLATSTTTRKPCKKGQERNPDTNRCRNSKAMPAADYAVLGAQTTSNGTWYIWAAIGGVLLLAVGYAIWEWRQEIASAFKKLRGFVRHAK